MAQWLLAMKGLTSQDVTGRRRAGCGAEPDHAALLPPDYDNIQAVLAGEMRYRIA